MDARRDAGTGQVWQVASGLMGSPLVEKNSPRFHDIIDRRVRVVLQGLARSQAVSSPVQRKMGSPIY
jgi:hypothetical protein